MKRLLPIFTLTLLAMSVAFVADAQTFCVWCGTNDQGASVYKEVYEYDYVTQKPEYPGGRSALCRHIQKTRKYPTSAYRRGIQGRVTVSFVINTDGSVSHLSVLRGVDPDLNKEALRIFSLMPDWTPGRQNGKPVSVRVIESIVFRK